MAEADGLGFVLVQIQSIQPLGEDEVVTIVNLGSEPVDLTGWRLESSNSLGQGVKQTFWFPKGCILPPGGVLRVHSGPYVRGWGDRSCGHLQIDLPWTVAKIWSDSRDVAWLRDSQGALIDLYTYAAPGLTAATEGVGPGPATATGTGPFGLELRAQPRRPPWCWCQPLPCLHCPLEYHCEVEVFLEAIEPVYNYGVGTRWHFFVTAVGTEPWVSPEELPQLIYRGRLRGPQVALSLEASAIEQDLWPDHGRAQRTLHLCCHPSRDPGEWTVRLYVHVVENESPCAGCEALWEFTFRVLLTPRPWKWRWKWGGEGPALLPPQAKFTISPPGEWPLGEVVTLDASSSVGRGLRYEWDFDGDGRPDATGVRVQMRLDRPGLRFITLTVTDLRGQQDSLTQGIRVRPLSPEGVREGEGKRVIDLLPWLLAVFGLGALGLLFLV